MEQEKRHIVSHLMLERLVGIHKKIKSGTFPNTRQLAEEFNGGKGIATISRDIEFLRDRFGAPIEYDHGHRGYFYTSDFEMPLNAVSPDAMVSLFAAKIMLSRFKDSPFYDNACKTINLIANSDSNEKTEILRRIALSPSPMPAYIIEENVWKTILHSLRNNLKIEFDYNGRWNPNNTHRKIHPYQIVMDNGNYFLYGFSEERNETRLFSLARIKNPKTTEETFLLPEDFEFEKHCGGGRFGSFSYDEPDHYKIEFYENARQMLKDFIWADDQKIHDDETRNCTTIEFSSTQYLKIEEWILSQGCYAKPLEPQWLVDEWKAHIKGMMDLAKIK